MFLTAFDCGPEVHVKPLLTLIAALRTNVGRLWRSVFSLAFLHTICVTFCVSALNGPPNTFAPEPPGRQRRREEFHIRSLPYEAHLLQGPPTYAI